MKSKKTVARGGFTTSSNYYDWEFHEVTAGPVVLQIVSKPGVPFFGEADPSTHLLAEILGDKRSEVILNLNSGAGLVGAAAATLNEMARVIMTNRNFLAVEAAQKTLRRNRIKNAEVHFSNGLGDFRVANDVDVVLIRLPKGKLPALQLLWDGFRALKVGGTCYIAGANREGVKTVIGFMRQLFGNAETIKYRDGHRIACSEKQRQASAGASAFQINWLDYQEFQQFSVDVRGKQFIVHSRPGVFAWDRMDEGTRLLIEHMAIDSSDTVLDLGCGTGIVGMVAASLATCGHAVLLDADAEAIRCARRSVEANALRNCSVVASDAGYAVRHKRFDVVATNPPFHVGRRAEFSIAHQFILDAWDALNRGGRFYLVANVSLPYEKAIHERFGSFRSEFQDQGYKVISAVKRS